MKVARDMDFSLSAKLKNTDPMLNILTTIITIERYAELEPCAPSPLDKMEGALLMWTRN
ncbi:MAG: hypothetical protein QW628_11345 [Thermofilum sp.]